MASSKKKNPLDNCENLIEIDAPGFIQEFHNHAVGSISAMAGAFSGLATALQSQNNRSEEIEHRLVETNDALRLFGEKMAEAERIVTDLAERIEEQLTNINQRFEQHSEEFEQKLDSQNQELRGFIEDTTKHVMKEMKKDCKKMISKVASSVKNTENQIKSLNKTCQDNRDKIEITKQKVDESRQEMKTLQEETKRNITELNNYVEKTTTDLKDYVDVTSKRMKEQNEDLDKRFQEFRFKTDNDLARKADVEDLKRKMDVGEFLEFAQKHKESQEDQEEMNDKINTQITEEKKERARQQDTCDSAFALAETDRRQIHEELEYIKSRVGDVPDPSDAVENLHNKLMDHISQVEAILREEMKARMVSQGAPAPSFGGKDGACFSCGRGGTPSSGAFPPMKSRSPRGFSSGGFRSPKSKKMKGSKSFEHAANKMMSPPKRLQNSQSLPHLPKSGHHPITPNTQINHQENSEQIPIKLKLPAVEPPLNASSNVAVPSPSKDSSRGSRPSSSQSKRAEKIQSLPPTTEVPSIQTEA